ncbi:MAG: putative rane protein [Bacteroidetes bacterium]|nr:putative rane protein [Bacteroidota bacterium]
MGWIGWIIIGVLSGWIAGKLMRGGGFGFIVNFVVGIIGALIGGWIFGILKISAGGIVGSLVTSVVGAVVFLSIISFFYKKS